MTQNWQLKDYTEAFEKGVMALFNTVFKKNRSKTFLDWENRKNPAGESIIKLALQGERVIGHTCLWLFRLKAFDNEITAGQSIDTMVDPDFRRMGIFETLSGEGLETGKAKEMALNFRFPNHMALSAAVNRLNTVKICEIPQYIKLIKGYKAASMFSGNPVIRLGAGTAFSLYNLVRGKIRSSDGDYTTKTIKHFNEGFDRLWQQEKQHYDIAVVRDSRYLNWRYGKAPVPYHCIAVYKDSHPVGYMVTAIEDKTAKDGTPLKLGHIVDIFCAKEEAKALRSLIAEGEKYLKSQGVCGISCWMLKHVFYADYLSKFGYLQLRCPSVLAARILSDDLLGQKEKIYDSRHWFVTIGDSDYV